MKLKGFFRSKLTRGVVLFLLAASFVLIIRYGPLATLPFRHLHKERLWARGELETAIAEEENTCALVGEILGKNNRYYSVFLFNLGDMYLQIGDYARAEANLQQSRKICLETFGRDNVNYAHTLYRLSELYSETYDIEKYEAVCQELLDVARGECRPYWLDPFRDWLTGDPEDIDPVKVCEMGALDGLGRVCHANHEYDHAEEYFCEALELLQGLEGEHPYETACLLSNIAAARAYKGNLDGAEQMLDQALTIIAAVLDTESGVARAFVVDAYSGMLNERAHLFRQRGKYEQAMRCIEEALGVIERFSSAHRAQSLGFDTDLLGIMLAQGELQRSKNLADELASLLRSNMAATMVGATDNTKLGIFDRTEYPRNAIFSAVLGPLAGIPDSSTLGLDVSLTTKGMVLDIMASEQGYAAQAQSPEWQKDYAELRRLRQELQEVTFAGRISQSEAPNTAELEAAIESAEQALAKENLAFAEDIKLRNVNEQMVRAALAPDQILLEFIKYTPVDFGSHSVDTSLPERYACFVVSPNQPRPPAVDLGEADVLEAKIREYRECLNAQVARREITRETEAELAEIGRALFRTLLEPLGSVVPLDGSSCLIVCPDGLLHFIPLEVLVVSDATRQDIRYLGESCTVTYVSSGRECASWLDGTKTPSSAPVVIGDPDFGLSAETALAVVQNGIPSRPSATTMRAAAESHLVPSAETVRRANFTLAGADFGWHWESLDASREYCETVARLLGTRKLYLGETALEETVKAVQSPRVLAIATHGFYDSIDDAKAHGDSKPYGPGLLGKRKHHGSDNPLLRSGLVFAGANHPEQLSILTLSNGQQLNDGILTALEVSALDLRGTDLVSLTACETGLGELQAGVGVSGLQQAFRQAGARSMLISLWRIPVEQATDAAKEFFHGWIEDSQPKAEAHRRACLRELEIARSRLGTGHPIFWAGTILVGNPN